VGFGGRGRRSGREQNILEKPAIIMDLEKLLAVNLAYGDLE
jgi:hypothetical protein